MKPRHQIDRRITLIRMALSAAPRRGEADEDFERRIAGEIERLARRIADDCAEMRGAPPRAWIETPDAAENPAPRFSEKGSHP